MSKMTGAATDNSATATTNPFFHAGMSTQTFATALSKYFIDAAGMSPSDIADMKRSWAETPVPGQPIRPEKIALFEYIEAQHENGMQVDSALQSAIEQGLAPMPRRRRSRYDRDPLQDRETLQREYFRYREKKRSGLEPSIAYGRNALFDSILAKQWDIAAAIFSNANKVWRTEICGTLNHILQNRTAK